MRNAGAGLQFLAADLERQIRRDDPESGDHVDESRRSDDLAPARVRPELPKRQQQSRQASDMVAVHVADEDEVDVLDAPAEASQADLRAFAAVEEQQVPAERMSALDNHRPATAASRPSPPEPARARAEQSADSPAAACCSRAPPASTLSKSRGISSAGEHLPGRQGVGGSNPPCSTPQIEIKQALTEADPKGPVSCLALVLALVIARRFSDTRRLTPCLKECQAGQACSSCMPSRTTRGRPAVGFDERPVQLLGETRTPLPAKAGRAPHRGRLHSPNALAGRRGVSRRDRRPRRAGQHQRPRPGVALCGVSARLGAGSPESSTST